MAICPASPGAGLVERLVGSVDCHIRVMVHDSYADLVGPGTPFASAFTVLLTIYIALMGYQLLLGRGGLRLTDLPVSALKIGLILAFLTSWAAYQTVVFDLLFEGPREVMAALLGPMTRGAGFSGDLYEGVESAYARLAEAASTYGAMASPNANILQGGPMLGSGLLWFTAIAMLLATVGLILAAKIVLGFLLAVGPVFIGLFLFDATRGFFDGWVRTTVAFALAPLAATVFGAAMLIMMEPFLATLAELASQRRFDMGAVITLALIVSVFLIVMAQVARVSAGIASGFSTRRDKPAAAAPAATAPAAPPLERQGFDRGAELIARAAAGADRVREDRAIRLGEGDRRAETVGEAVTSATARPATLGDSHRRMPRPTRPHDGSAR